MSIATFSEPPRRRRGRPRDRDNPEKREKMIHYCTLVLSQAISVKGAAGALDVARCTVTDWCDRLLADYEPDTDGLRALAEKYPRRKYRLYTRRRDTGR